MVQPNPCQMERKKMVKTIKPTFLVFSNTFIVYVCFHVEEEKIGSKDVKLILSNIIDFFFKIDYN